MDYRDKMANILGADREVILSLEKKMERISGKSDVLEEIVRTNEDRVRKALIALGFGTEENFFDVPAERVYRSLLERADRSNRSLMRYFHQPDFATEAGCRELLGAAKELSGLGEGFYLKAAKARELLKSNPPKKILNALGYGSDVDKMLEREDVLEVFCALRFIEDEDWLSNVFFRAYDRLTQEDFEQRPAKMVVLPLRWSDAGRAFLKKKLHHMSHLKELGVIFVIPLERRQRGEALYMFFMALHYLYEVDWHARLFKKYSAEDDFAAKVVGALEVGVSDCSLPADDKMSWRVVPKYLAKKDPRDPRLSEPHVSPEAWHYTRATEAIKKFSSRFPELELGFWIELDAVCDHFPAQEGRQLVSFSLFDNGISLIQDSENEQKFSYHQQEALWNKIFSEYMGEDEMDDLMMENLAKGYITL